jgi:DNA-binding response OmpR family regulator
MATPPTPLAPQVGILVFEDDPYSGTALRQMLDSEGWRVRLAPDMKMLQTELKTGEYSLLRISRWSAPTLLFHVLRGLADQRGRGARLRSVCGAEMTGSQFIQL